MLSNRLPTVYQQFIHKSRMPGGCRTKIAEKRGRRL